MPEYGDFLEENGVLPEWPYPIKYDVENEVSADVLIVGGGVAGCHAAITVARMGLKPVIVETGPLITSGAGGTGVDHWLGCCTNPCSKISPEEYMQETESESGSYRVGIGGYINCRESYDTLLDVEKLGIQVRDINDEFVGAEFRDEKTKLMFAYDYENRYNIRVCGAEMKRALFNEIERLGVKHYDRVMATSLLTEGGKQGARVVGATGVNVRTGEFYVFKAKATIISTGGQTRMWIFSTELQGSTFECTTQDTNNTGAGFAAAWNAGAEFSGMEQSRPSGGAFDYVSYGVGNMHNTWYACNLVDANGKEIPWVDRDGREVKTLSERYRPSPGQKLFDAQQTSFKLAPASYKLRSPFPIPDLAERIERGEYVLPLYADLPSMPPLERRALFGLMVGNEGKTRYAVYGNYTRAGFDPDKDMLQAPVFPPDWYTQSIWKRAPVVRQWREGGGGLVVNWDLRTNLEGLYAAGGSALGAGGHSGSATTGKYAARNACEYARRAALPVVDARQVKAEKARVYAPVKRDNGIGWKELHAGICRIMQDYCGEAKHESTLKMGLWWLEQIKEKEAAEAYARNPHELMRTLDTLARITVGEMIMNASLARKASCPSMGFKRIDYPEVDPPEWKKFVTIKLEEGEVKPGELPLNYWLMEPYAPTYQENYRLHSHL